MIIGILIAGVTQSSRLVAKSRFSNARTLTQSSPIASIKNVVLWIETTSESSVVDSETENGSGVTNLYDLNPQTSIKANFTQATLANKPTYTTSSTGTINSLPTLTFNGSSTNMASANFNNLTTAASVFMVVKTPASLAAGVILGKRTAATAAQVNFEVKNLTNGWQFCDVLAGAESCYSSTASALVINTAYVVSIVYTASASTAGVSFWQNGSASGVTAATGAPSGAVTDPLYLGQSGLSATQAYFTGSIGEIIIFDRAVKNEERDAIEAYLGQKWGVTVL